MAQQKDDLEAVRALADTLEPFSPEDRARIIRWACEKLGMLPLAAAAPLAPGPVAAAAPAPQQAGARDIRSFINEKDPKSDLQLAAVVAFYHRFVSSERKDSINSEDLVEACRQSDRNRPKRPAQTLVNAYAQGLLNRGDHGQYSINAVGENLVAMVLPDQGANAGARASKTQKKKSVGKRPRKSAATRKKA